MQFWNFPVPNNHGQRNLQTVDQHALGSPYLSCGAPVGPRRVCGLTRKGENWRSIMACWALGRLSLAACLLAWTQEHSVKAGYDGTWRDAWFCLPSNLPHANEVIRNVFSLGNHSCQQAGGILWPHSHALIAAGWDSPVPEPPSILPGTPRHSTSHLCQTGSSQNEHLHEQFRSLYKQIFELQERCTFSYCYLEANVGSLNNNLFIHPFQ